mgnify:CR=1 FL=1
MDLNNTEIYIQYEDSKGNKDVCQEWVRDIESDPDFLIFGWALRDPITKYDGTLKFSVRFGFALEECTRQLQENYLANKNKRLHPDRVEVKKYCPRCNKKTVHKEKK